MLQSGRAGGCQSGGLSPADATDMLRRPLLLLAGLAGAVTVPYLLLGDGVVGSTRQRIGRMFRSEPTDTGDPLATWPLSSDGTNPPLSIDANRAALLPTGPTIEEAFRFDVTPAWVAGRWKRVSTVLGEPEQLGMRVALVSGTRPDDVAGSLTYYFDKHHRLERLTFFGATGDARRLLLSVVTPYGLKSQPTTGAADYIAGDPQNPSSRVSVRHMPVIEVGSPARVEVAIDLRRSDALGWGRRQGQEREPGLLPASYRRW